MIHDLLPYYPYKLMTLMTIPFTKGLPMINEDTPSGKGFPLVPRFIFQAVEAATST